MAETRLAIRELLRCSSYDDSVSFATTCGRLLSVSVVGRVADPCLENVHSALKKRGGGVFLQLTVCCIQDYILLCFVYKHNFEVFL